MIVSNKNIALIIYFVLFSSITIPSIAQKSMMSLFKSDFQLAEEYFMQQEYSEALKMYFKSSAKKGFRPEIYLKIARCYYYLKNYSQAVQYYEKIKPDNLNRSQTDLFYYAEALASLACYKMAIEVYQRCLLAEPDNEMLMKKIWRLHNIQFLYEDSVHFAIKEVPINTTFSELAACPYQEGIVFLSNKENPGGIQKINATNNTPFYRLFYSAIIYDSIGNILFYEKPVLFDKIFKNKYHMGSVAFYQHGQKMVFTATAEMQKSGKGKTLQLLFSEKTENNWEITASFPFNSLKYSNSNPSITEDGKLLLFSSDKKGGYGGKDIYSSRFENGSWSEPENLGDEINSREDELYPYLMKETLYFSSNGHPGLGGLDVFKAEYHNGKYSAVENMGYPLNSSYDDFGIYIDTLNTSGYITSNRKNGGYNDNLYAFEMDLQTYPLKVEGVLKYIEHNWLDSSNLKTLSDVSLFLIDNERGIKVAEAVADSNGNFSFIVPYFSKYKLQVAGPKIEGLVSFEVAKHKKANDKYEIVIVHDDFKRTIDNPATHD